MQDGDVLFVKPRTEKKGTAYCALKRAAVLAALNAAFTLSCKAASGTWAGPAGGSWTNAAKWTGAAIADGTNATADFSTLNLTSATAVTLDGARTIGHLTFADAATASHDWTLSAGSGGPLTLAVGSGAPTLTVTNRTATISAVIAGASGLTKSGAGTLTLSGTNTYSGKTRVEGGNLTFNTIGNVGAPASALGAPANAADGTIDLNAFLTYTGAAAATSDRAIFLTGSNGILYNTGSNLLTLTGGITGDNRNFRFRGTGEIIETGLIATGNGTVSRTDNGTVTLTNPGNSFSGAVTVYAGTLSVDSLSNSNTPSALGQGSSISFGQTGYTGFGKLRFTGAGGGACNRTLTVNSPGGTASGGIIENTVAGQTLLFSGPVGVGGAGPTPQLQLTGAGDGALSGTLSGSGLALTKSGAGTWTLSGTNTHAGVTTVNEGLLSVGLIGNGGGAGSHLGSASCAASNLVLGGGTLRYTGSTASTDRQFTLTPGTVGTFEIANAATALTLAGASAATSGALLKAGPGTLTLAGTNAYTGSTTVADGTLEVGGAGQLGNGDYAGDITNQGTFAYSSTAPQTLFGVMGGAGALLQNGPGTLTLAGMNTYTGQTTVAGGTLRLGGASGNVLADVSTVTLTGGTFDLADRTETVTHFAVTGAAALTSSGTGCGVLTSANSNTPSLSSVAAGGTLTLAGGTLSETGYFVNNGTVNIDGGTLTVVNELLNGFNTAGAALHLNSGVLMGTMISFGGNQTCRYHFNGGTLQCNQFKRRSAKAVDFFFNGVTVQARSTASADFLPNFAATAGQNAWISTGGMTVDSNAKDITISMSLRHDILGAATDGGLTKTGAGTLTLSGSNTYNGATAISNGALLVSGSLGSGPVAVKSGASLGGSGTLGGAVTLEAGSTLCPGAGGASGTLTVSGALTLEAGSTTVMEIARNGTALTGARLQVAGPLTFGGTLVISDLGGTPLQVGDTFQLFNALDTIGTFASILSPPGYTFDESLLADGTLLVVTAPPPPGFQTFSVGGGTVALTWPAQYRGWLAQLNSADLANPDAWIDLPGSEDVTSLSFPLDPYLPKAFYRLRSPDATDFTRDPLAKGTGLTFDTVWSGVFVGFAFLTLSDVQIAAYYNPDRELILAARNLNSTNWCYQATGELYAGWDSHNYIALSADPLGHVHVSANMHRVPMNYYRSEAAVTNAAQFQTPGFMRQLSPLWNSVNEAQSTYPSYFTGPNGEFVFSYRNHTSATAGSWYLLNYDTAAQTFANATGANALFTWTGNYSVYPAFSVAGDYVHCLFMWRGSGDAASNYRLSYLRSTDLMNWTDAFGRAVILPVSPSASLTTIDNVPQAGGLLNGQPKLSFDRDGVPLVAYHKYDSSGHSQVYVARPLPASLSWKIVPLTASSWTWNFSGGGSLPPGGSVANGFAADDPVDGLVTVNVTMRDDEGALDPSSGSYTLDETTLDNLLGTAPNPSSYASANAPAANTADVDSNVVQNPYVAPVTGATMGIRRLDSSGTGFADMHYYLRWETLPGDNRDAPKKDAAGNVITPTPSALQLYRTRAEFGNSLLSVGGTFYGRMFKPATASLFGAMTRASDSAATFGTTLSSAATGTAHFAQWTFNVDTAGEYALGGSAYAAPEIGGGFRVQVDNGPLTDWRGSGRWDYQPVTSGSAKGMTRFRLTRGAHTLRLYAQEPGARLAYLWLNLPSLAKAPSLAPVSHTGFTLAADATAVSGCSLGSPVGSSPAGSTAHYELPVSQAGNHLLLGRTRAPDANSDSFYLAVNSGAPQLWTLPVSGTEWVWKAFGTALNLSAGTLGLDVTGREGGAELDSFMLLKVP